jgi:hypothetical protein
VPLSNKVTAVNILGRRVDAVTLVQALGGWNTSERPQRPECCGKLISNSVMPAAATK